MPYSLELSIFWELVPYCFVSSRFGRICAILFGIVELLSEFVELGGQPPGWSYVTDLGAGKVIWTPVADKYLKNRKVILDNDRAKSYETRVKGIIHDSVRHCKKRVKLEGKRIRRNPIYSKVLKKGTQIIDRTWRFIRPQLDGFSKEPGTNRFASAVRSFFSNHVSASYTQKTNCMSF